MISDKKEIRLIVADVEHKIIAPVAKAQSITDYLSEIYASAISPGVYKLTKQQYADFASKSTIILY